MHVYTHKHAYVIRLRPARARAGYIEAISVAKKFAANRNYYIRSNQEMFNLAVNNLFGGSSSLSLSRSLARSLALPVSLSFALSAHASLVTAVSCEFFV